MISITPQTKVLVLTGAGISAESGISTFRDSGGLWENHRVEDVATPEAFLRNPTKVWEFYHYRWLQSRDAKPNPAHQALVTLEQKLGKRFHLITQNIDGLHTRAGNKRILEMHGSLHQCICTACKTEYPMQDMYSPHTLPHCPKCGAMLRPDIVWFGEVPYHLYEIEQLLVACDLFVIVGTSGAVYPAAGFVMTAKLMGAKTLAVNLDPPDNMSFIDTFYQGKSGELLPDLVDKWLS